MKKEIEEILDDTLRSFDEIEDIPEAADKIISLIDKKLDECKPELDKYFEYDIDQIGTEATQDIINIIRQRMVV